jgi:hypothetical protein
MPFNYTNSAGKVIETKSKINMCESRGMMSFCRASTIKDQYGCKFRVDSSDKHCLHFRESVNSACDSLLAQIGKEPYDCKDCSVYTTCKLKSTEDECSMMVKKTNTEKK